jgi:hypothetical protein
MPDENDNSQPPQPVLIQGGGIAPSENDPTTQENAPQPTPEESVDSPDESQSNPTNYLAEAIERYESLKSTSDPGNILIAISFVIMAVSLFIGVSAAMDGLFNGGTGDGTELCFGGLLTGALLSGVGALQSSSYHEQLKKALAEIKSLANLPEKKATPSYALLGFILCALGILVVGIIDGLLGFLLLLGGLLILLGGALTGSTSEKHEDVLAAAKKEVLRREGSYGEQFKLITKK